MGKFVKLLVVGLALWVAARLVVDFRRPYALETLALEVFCPANPNDFSCFTYSHFGLIYSPPKMSTANQTVQCSNPDWHFVGYNSDGAAQCCGPGFTGMAQIRIGAARTSDRSMGYRSQNDYDAAERETWRKLPWHERYDWRLVAIAVVVLVAFAAGLVGRLKFGL